MANTVIALKKSGTPSSVPTSLANGELAINYADGKLYYKAANGSILSISGSGGGGASSNSFATINANNTLVVADSPTGILTLTPGSGIAIVGDAINDKITISATGSAGPSDKTYTFYQNTAPATSNARDLWVNSDTGIVYQNFGNTSSPVWAEFGPTGVANTVNAGIVYTSNINFTDGSYQTTAAFGNATAAFAKANAALANATGTFAGDLTVTGNVTTSKQIFATYRPATTVNAAVHIAAANTKGGSSYADIFRLTNLSGGTNIDKWIRINNIGTLEVINSAYSANIFELSDVGDMVISGNTRSNGVKPGYAPNRPAFRVYGDGTTNINATTTLKNTNWAVDFEQGSNLNGTTGIFTAPVEGLYSVNLTARTQTNSYVGTSAIAVQKTSGVLTTNVCYIEWYNNTTANHMGSSTIVKLAAGDTLKVVVTAGQVTFDLNDNWAVAYIG